MRQTTNKIIITFNWLYASYVSFIFSALTYKKNSLLGAFASFSLNFPMSANFGYEFGEFISEIPKQPLNAIGLLIGTFPAIAGLTLGFDGSGELIKNKIFQIASAAAMFNNMWNTRGVGIVGISKDFYQTCFAPLKWHNDPNTFYRNSLIQKLDHYPALTYPINSTDLSTNQLSPESIQQLCQSISGLSPLTCHQKIYKSWRYLRSLLSTALFIASLSTIPLWTHVAKTGWSHINENLGNNAFLVNITMAINLIFYARSSYRAPKLIIDKFYVPMTSATYNNQSSAFANFTRITAVTLFSIFILFLAWESGGGMGYEAENADLKNDFFGLLSFLTPIYGLLIQFFAGIIVNGSSFASFSTTILPRFDKFNQLRDIVLQKIGAKKEPSNYNLAEILNLSENSSKINKHKLLKILSQESNPMTLNEIRTQLSGQPLKYLNLFKLNLNDRSPNTENHNDTYNPLAERRSKTVSLEIEYNPKIEYSSKR